MERRRDDRVYVMSYKYDGIDNTVEVLAFNKKVAEEKIMENLNVTNRNEIEFSIYNPISFCSYEEWLKNNTKVIVQDYNI